MPKRIIDGDALWTSNKLAKLPTDMRAEYANLLPLALANGSFECDPRKVWAKVYYYNRPDITQERVVEILNQFEQVGLLLRWTQDEKLWGYWVGIDKPGRLPPNSRRNHEARGANPPNGNPMVSQQEAKGYIGIGKGKGKCIGKGIGVPKRRQIDLKTECQMPGCGKPTKSGQRFCSKTCLEYGKYLEREGKRRD